jgi:hypothetical protein
MNSFRLSIWLILLLLCATPLLAQFQLGGSTPAAKGPEYNVGIGYSQIAMNMSGKRVNLSGAEASATIYGTPHWGVTLDCTYARGPRDPGSGHGSYLFTALTGPVFVPAQTENTRLFIRALAGLSVVDGSVPVNQLYYRGWLARFAWAAGTGIERNLRGPFATRLNFDYLRTRFMGTTAEIEAQNDVRFSGTLVLRLAGRRQTHYMAVTQP